MDVDEAAEEMLSRIDEHELMSPSTATIAQSREFLAVIQYGVETRLRALASDDEG